MRKHKQIKRQRRFDRAYNTLHTGWGQYPRGVNTFNTFMVQYRTQPIAALKSVGF